jgi:3-phosphoshikimate 1-carboxyvinyltransferase
VTVKGGSMVIAPPPSGRGALQGGVIDPAGDHRIAMAFAVAGLAVAGVTILDPGCVGKSFPGFFTVLDSLREA